MRIGHRGIRHQFLNPCRHIRDPVHTVVDKKYLTVSGKFPADRLSHQFLVIFHHVGLDRHAVQRRLLQNTHVPDADQAHMERPRYRRRRQGKHIHVPLHLLDFFLMGHTEPLLLIDDQQSEILERDVLRQHAVGSDQNVHHSLANRLNGLLLLGICPETAQHIDPDRKILHPLGKGIKMLLRKYCRRTQENDLLVLLHCLEGGADRDLGLPVADVAADQAVHGLAALHIPLRVLDCLKLILRLFEREHLLKLSLPLRVRSVLIPLRSLTGGIQSHQLLRDIFYRAPDPAPGL